jgi:hypothetical protein
MSVDGRYQDFISIHTLPWLRFSLCDDGDNDTMKVTTPGSWLSGVNGEKKRNFQQISSNMQRYRECVMRFLTYVFLMWFQICWDRIMGRSCGAAPCNKPTIFQAGAHFSMAAIDLGQYSGHKQFFYWLAEEKTEYWKMSDMLLCFYVYIHIS